jgi:hypothetical protein
MVREVRSIPPAPRRVRLRSLLGYRWPLLFAAFVMTVYGGLFTWMLFLADGAKPSDNRRLEIGPVETAAGTVTSIEPARLVDGRPHERVHYEFAFADDSFAGAAFALEGRYEPDDAVMVELLPREPNINRIVGTRLHVARIWLHPGLWFATMVVPGFLVFLGWLAGVLHLRHVVVHGDVGVATVLQLTRVRWVLPDTLAVRYSFRDHRAVLRHGRHWVRAHGALGQRLANWRGDGALLMPVLHDRRFPQWSRLAVATDFASDSHPEPGTATISFR